MLTEIAYAKINLALHVRARRSDGFHEIESLFAFAQDGDVLTAGLAPGGALSLTIEGPFSEGLSAGPDNLVLRAAEALRRRHDVTSGAAIRLVKNLPVASGIGGGSADAAAALRLLWRLWGINSHPPIRRSCEGGDPSPGVEAISAGSGDRLPLSRERRTQEDDLLGIAATLGSDVPACVISRTLMGMGRGEALDLRALPGLAGMPLMLVNPRRPLSTGPVFAGWDEQDRGALRVERLEDVIVHGRNDLQLPAITLAPEIADVLDRLDRLDGVRLARMSGSGATCFALMESADALDRASSALAKARPDWWIMTSRVR